MEEIAETRTLAKRIVGKRDYDSCCKQCTAEEGVCSFARLFSGMAQFRGFPTPIMIGYGSGMLITNAAHVGQGEVVLVYLDRGPRNASTGMAADAMATCICVDLFKSKANGIVEYG